MTKQIISGSSSDASVPSLSDILMSLTNVKGAVACALGNIEHDNSDATGALTIALGEMERAQEQIEDLQRLAGAALSGGEVSTNDTASAPAAVPQPVRRRIATLRERMFGPMAAVDVASQAIRIEDDCNVHRLLADTYKQLDAIALDLGDIAGDAEPSEDASTEVALG